MPLNVRELLVAVLFDMLRKSPLFAALNVVNEAWDGRVLMCEEMPDDAPKGPKSWDFNKTVADVEYVVSRKLQESMVRVEFSRELSSVTCCCCIQHRSYPCMSFSHELSAKKLMKRQHS